MANSLVARQKPEEPFIFVPRREPEEPFIFLPRRDRDKDRLTMDLYHDELARTRIVPLPYPVPMPGNQGNNQGGFDVGRALGAMAGYLGMGLGNPAFTPGPILSGRYSDLMKETNERINSGRTPGIIPETAFPGFLSQMPRRIQGNYRPTGVFGSPPPNFDSPYMDEQIRRGFVPMTPPPSRGGGPQLPGFV